MRRIKQVQIADATDARGKSLTLFEWVSTEKSGWVTLFASVVVGGATFLQMDVRLNSAKVSEPVTQNSASPTRLTAAVNTSIYVAKGQKISVSYYYSNSSGVATTASSDVKLMAETDDVLTRRLMDTIYPDVFDVQTATSSGATGTSNGIGWTYSGVNEMAATNLDGGIGFMRSTKLELTASDQIHIWNPKSQPNHKGTFTFDVPLKGVFMYVKMNENMPQDHDLIQFTGIEPEIVAGDVLRRGDAIGAAEPGGGVVWLEMGGATTLEFSSPVYDDILDRCLDVAFVAIPAA